MNFFENIKKNLQNFLRENTKITTGITILLIALAVFAFASGIFQEKKKQDIFIFPKQKAGEIHIRKFLLLFSSHFNINI